jgi:hypothetical protein
MFSRFFAAMGFSLLLLSAQGVQAQNPNPGVDDLDGRVNAINTAVPFLRISPDARSGAMGDVGIAISPDANSVYWNFSKLPFAKKSSGLAITYTPWLKEIVNDVFLGQLAGYKQLDEFQTIGGSLRYFSLGDIQFTDISGNLNGNFRPREFAFDFGYARKLSDHWSLGLAMRYIHSNLASGVNEAMQTIRPGKSVAADLSAYYTKDIETNNGYNNFSFGVAITNIGSRISYTQSAEKDFIPTNLGIGTAYTLGLDELNKLTFALDVNKLLVPTPKNGTYPNKSMLEGMFSSFGDAPGGFKEELNELMYSIGTEYSYNDIFAVRAGYYNEHATKGNRKYFSAGVGLQYERFGLNFSYLVPSGSGIQRNPLSNTLRFTLTLDLSGGN